MLVRGSGTPDIFDGVSCLGIVFRHGSLKFSMKGSQEEKHDIVNS